MLYRFLQASQSFARGCTNGSSGIKADLWLFLHPVQLLCPVQPHLRISHILTRHISGTVFPAFKLTIMNACPNKFHASSLSTFVNSSPNPYLNLVLFHSCSCWHTIWPSNLRGSFERNKIVLHEMTCHEQVQ